MTTKQVVIKDKWRTATPAYLKRIWLRALRSGKYKRTRSIMFRKQARKASSGFCCLGVLSHKVLNGNVECRLGGGVRALPSATFYDAVPGLDWVKKNQFALANMNDNGKSFKNIANWIEKHWEV